MCLATAACCCLSSICSMASCCGSASKMGARAARVIYTILYFFAGLLALLLKYFGSKIFLDFIVQVGCVDPDNNSTLESPTSILDPIFPDSGASYTLPCAGSQAVYRISFGMLSFFLVCGIVSAIIKQFHQGWWFIKILLYIAALIYPFFIPAFVFDGYQQAARYFAGLFLVFQMLTYIACAYNLHEGIMEKSEEFTEKQSKAGDDDKCMCINCWTILYLFLCVAGVVGILSGIVLMYMNFPCFLPTFMTSVSLVIALVVCILCVLSKFARGLLTGVVIACYTTFLCWSALTSNPDNTIVGDNNQSCNPFLCDPTDPDSDCDVGTMIVGILFTIVSISYAGFSLGDSASTEDGSEGEDEGKKKKKKKYKSGDATDEEDVDAKSIPLSRDLEKDGSINSQAKADAEEAARDEAEEDADADDDASCCGCKMSANARNALFQLVMCLACFYMAMLLTNWATYEASNVAGVGTASMWIKFVSQWATVALFLWTLIAPLCCPNRSFD
eukprot:INCI14677.1.p1 GENE.INCI14677.1~~INCI14677.1.p1  ORF type:complete len:502 (+),score=93.62 INCI14677.1:280-1785(+)